VPYDAFVSYSHAADGQLAPRLQSGLERFATPTWHRRAIRVFRDETGLTANPHLWSSIATALDDSAWFVLLASPDSAASTWVGREIEHWVSLGRADRILLVVTDGTFVWDPAARDIDWDRSTAAHPALRGVFADEPRWVDLTWARTEAQLHRRHSRFHDALAELAAPIRGIPKEELAGEDVRQHRRARRLARTAVSALAGLTVVALVAGAVAWDQRGQARDERFTAEEQRAIAEEQARRADDQAVIAEDQAVLAEEQRELAEQQRALAEQRAALGAAASAVAQTSTRLDLALLLGAEAAAMHDARETRAGLLSALGAATPLVAFHPETGAVNGVAVSVDGRRAVTVAIDGTVRTWSRPGWELEAEVVLDPATALRPHAVELRDGDRAVAVFTEPGVVVLDAADLQPRGVPIAASGVVAVLSREEAVPRLADVTADASLAAVAAYLASSIDVVPVGDPAARTTFGVADCVGLRGVEFHPDGTSVIAVCDNAAVLLGLDGVERARHLTFGALGGLVSATYSPDGSVLALVTGAGQIDFVDPTTLEPLASLPAAGAQAGELAFSADGTLLAVGSSTGAVTVWSTFAWLLTPVAEWRGIDGGVLGAVTFRQEPDASGPWTTRVVTASGGGVAEWAPERLTAVATERERFFFDYLDPGRDERYAAIGPRGEPQVVGVLDATGAIVRTFEPVPDAHELVLVDHVPELGLVVAAAARFPEPPTPGVPVPPERLDLVTVDVATGATHTIATITSGLEPPAFELEQYALHPELVPPEGRVFPSVTARLRPDGALLYAAIGPTGRLWDVASGADLAQAPIPAPMLPVLTWTPDGTALVATTWDGIVRFWDATDLSETVIDLGGGFTVNDLDAVPALDAIAVTTGGGTVVLVDAASRTVVGPPFEAPGAILEITVVDPARGLVASLDLDRRLHLWTIDDRVALGPAFQVLPELVTDWALLVATADGVAVADQARTIDVSLDVDEWIARACELAGRSLTDEEWEQYVGMRPETPACS
jgi:WD40 repeat protein